MTHPLEAALRKGAAELNLALDDAQIASLLAYLGLIQKWTKVYNLTAVRDPAQMLTHHLLDSLAVIEPLQRSMSLKGPVVSGADLQGAADGTASAPLRLLDVGSGAGLPGVVIALCCPQVTVHCVDAVAKKRAFIQQVAATLRLPNLHGLHARVESLAGPYDVICSRAFATLVDFTQWSSGALAEQGVWLAMKGKLPGDEIAILPPSIQMFHVEPVTVPGLDAERCLVWMRRKQATAAPG